MRLPMLLLGLVLPCGLNAMPDMMRDPQDGWLDVSRYLLERQYSFLPVPIIITEPALDQGVGMSALFFHDNNKQATDEFVTPSVSALAAAYTGNGSWFTGGGHRGIWRNDTLHYQGWAGYGSINLEYFGQAGSVLERGFEFNNEGAFTQHELLARAGESDWFLGGRFEYSYLDVAFDLSSLLPVLPTLEGTFSNSALGLAAEYDARDSVFTPNRGHYLRLDLLRYDEAIGGDFDYTSYQAAYRGFWRISDWVIGLRAEGTDLDGGAPFYARPFLNMRGIPANRYQGDTIGLLETEVRWDFHPRVSGLAFYGAGRAASSVDDFADAATQDTVGVGLRYLLAKKMGLRAGFDVGWGPEDTVFYITVGQSWSF